ncbi:MAG TPA: biotin--[acetyl-CoA-carboxylase] ligase [Pyrinomonadaceae bacterium]|nr:biotin--[acetyl-CoA-carboxylase] ligase [Pyrinomonadaceae bacterium]
MNITILNFDTIESTNTEAINQAKLGADEGLCVIAREQTHGRGRHGRVWVSPKDEGLYFSIVLRPKLELQYIPLITLAAGIAVHETLEGFGVSSDIKWVNDILVDGRKIGGILGETTETPKGLAVILGIGINVANQSFPPVIETKATSLRDHSVNGISPEVLLQPLIKNITKAYEMLLSPNGLQQVIDQWGKRSSYFKGKSVKVILEGSIVRGVTDGLEPSGALRVITDEGSVRLIQAGHVELLREAE